MSTNEPVATARMEKLFSAEDRIRYARILVSSGASRRPTWSSRKSSASSWRAGPTRQGSTASSSSASTASKPSSCSRAFNPCRTTAWSSASRIRPVMGASGRGGPRRAPYQCPAAPIGSGLVRPARPASPESRTPPESRLRGDRRAPNRTTADSAERPVPDDDRSRPAGGRRSARSFHLP